MGSRIGEALGNRGGQDKVAGVWHRIGWPLQALLEMRGLLFPWVPVCLALGIGLWFGLANEPGPAAYLTAAAVLVLGGLTRAFGPETGHAPAIALAAVAAGFLAAGGRAHWVQAPMLSEPWNGPVIGRVIEIDRSQSDALRLTLDRVLLPGLATDQTPHSVRVSLQGAETAPLPGQVVMVQARLAAPEGPAEPGGFDFRRMAYFDRLGAVGYTRSPVVLWEEAAPGAQMINRLRMHLSAAIRERLPGDSGAFASGAMTGDRSGITRPTVEALRDSNLAHLLAISGMNMAFLTGFVFLLLRHGLALVPVVALRVNGKKLAAVVALGVAGFYLLLSGANVATERAFLMVTVMLGAVLFDRRALTLRSVALAACVLLLWQPETLAEPGFQMSFAATVALIAGFNALDRGVMRERLPRWLMPVFTLVLSSVLAGAATAPYSAAHFNRFTDYGLLANLLTVPVMSVLMAAGAVAALLAPLGLAQPALWLMDLAARWILFVAHWVAGMEGAVTPIPAPGPWVLPLLTLGGCALVLLRGHGRLVGLAPVVAGLVVWAMADRPLALISADGALVGVLGDQGRVLSAPKGAGFVAGIWLEKDGDLADQATAAARPGFSGPKTARQVLLSPTAALQGDAPSACDNLRPCPTGVGFAPGKAETPACPEGCGRALRLMVLTGKTADLAQACAMSDLVVVSLRTKMQVPAPPGCAVIDRRVLQQTGALALWRDKTGWRLEPARRAARIWMGQTAPAPLPRLQ